jgi:hypothetical protein
VCVAMDAIVLCERRAGFDLQFFASRSWRCFVINSGFGAHYALETMLVSRLPNTLFKHNLADYNHIVEPVSL